jgi:hypothetical protein
VKKTARPDVYQSWLGLLSGGEYRAIVSAMNRAIDRTDVVRAQYIVCKDGDEWHKVYWPVFYAMGGSRELAGKFIGLILWETMQDRLEDWAFHKIDKTVLDDYNLVEEIQVMEYFRVEGFPKRGRWRDELRSDVPAGRLIEPSRPAGRRR